MAYDRSNREWVQLHFSAVEVLRNACKEGVCYRELLGLYGSREGCECCVYGACLKCFDKWLDEGKENV